MPRGSRRRRTAPGVAPIILVALLMAVGCRGLPAPGPDASTPSPPAVDPAPRVERPGAVADPASLPAPIIPIAEPPREAEAPAPTPMLDAALQRAEALNHEVAREIARPEAEPIRGADAPAATNIEAHPPINPSSIASTTPQIAEASPLDAEILTAEKPEGAIPVTIHPAGEPDKGEVPAVAQGQGSTAPEGVPPSQATIASDPPPPLATVLAINDLRACRRVLGFGHVEPSNGSECRPGRAILLYCEVTGVRYEPEGDHFRSRLASTIEAIPEAGGEPAWTQALGVAEDPCARGRHDYYVSYLIPLPRALPPGNYRFRLTLKDLADGASAAESIPIVVRP